MLQRAFDSGVERIIIPSIGTEGWDSLQALVESDERIYRGIGIHPHNVAAITNDDIARAERESTNTRVVAIGEIGLDYYYDFAPKDVQQHWFREQLRLAKRVDKPVIIHNRESDDDVLRIIEEEQDGTLKGVLHCFSSGTDILHRALDLGMHVSFTGNITFKKSLLDDVVRSVPDGRYMIETDSPYITPVPHRGKRNEPAHVRYIAEKIAELRNTTLESIITMTTLTANTLFRLAILTAMIIAPMQLLAQATSDTDSTDEPEVELVHPYPKSFGVSFIAVTNTIVDAWTSLDPAVQIKPNVYSYDGILSFGGSFHYAISDKIKFEFGYIRSKNIKKLRNLSDGFTFNDVGDSLPDIHQVLEGTMQYMFNPYSRVVFYGTGGISYLMNDFNGGQGFVNDKDPNDRGRTRNLLGLVGGIGLFVNINTPYGILAPGGEWRLNFFSSSEDSRFLYQNKYVPANVATFFSMPRISITFFPKF